jgi:hypothetical protein
MRQMLRCQPLATSVSSGAILSNNLMLYCVGAEVVSAVISCYLNPTVCKAERSAFKIDPSKFGPFVFRRPIS